MHESNPKTQTPLVVAITIAVIASIIFIGLMLLLGFSVLLMLNGYSSSAGLEPIFLALGGAAVFGLLVLNVLILSQSRRRGTGTMLGIAGGAIFGCAMLAVMLVGCSAAILLPALGA